RVLREPDVDLARELKTDPACVLSRRTGAETVPLHDDHVAHALARQVIGDRCADDSTTDDDDIRGTTHRGDGTNLVVGLLLRSLIIDVQADVSELVQEHASGACVERHEGSTPSVGTEGPPDVVIPNLPLSDESRDVWVGVESRE